MYIGLSCHITSTYQDEVIMMNTKVVEVVTTPVLVEEIRSTKNLIREAMFNWRDERHQIVLKF